MRIWLIRDLILFNVIFYLDLVIDSKEAAKVALIYVYKSAATGFSAKLTPEQVAEISSEWLFPFSNFIGIILFFFC